MGIAERTTEGIEPIGPIIGVIVTTIATRTVATIGTRVIVAVIVNAAAINPQLTRNEKGRSTSGLF